jgi:hypothetical protein
LFCREESPRVFLDAGACGAIRQFSDYRRLLLFLIPRPSRPLLQDGVFLQTKGQVITVLSPPRLAQFLEKNLGEG